MINMMPFQFISMYFGGEPIKAVVSGGKWQLNGADFVLTGLEGKPYEFATKENAEYWLAYNTMMSAQSGKTPQTMINRIQKKLDKTGAYWLTDELTVINVRNGFFEGINADGWFKWDDLFMDGGGA